VLKYNRAAIEERIERAAAYLGIEGGFDGFYAFVGELNASLGIPANLTELGVTDPDKPAIIKGALADPSTGGNPVEMTAENTAELLDACF
jgi:alcohol dehydrogenase class IV